MVLVTHNVGGREKCGLAPDLYLFAPNEVPFAAAIERDLTVCLNKFRWIHHASLFPKGQA